MSDSFRNTFQKALAAVRPLVLKGRGRFTCGREEIATRFRIRRMPNQTYVDIQNKRLAEQVLGAWASDRHEQWALDGTTEGGCRVTCSNLFSLGSSVSFGRRNSASMLLAPQAIVWFGPPAARRPESVTYWLVGIHDLQVDFSYGGWRIRASPSGTAGEVAAKAYDGWGVVTEGLRVTISHSTALIDTYEATITKLIQLLAIGCGTGITYHRYVVTGRDGTEAEAWRAGAGDDAGPGGLVPGRLREFFLRHCYPCWTRWSSMERDIARLVNGYLIQSHAGYLDVRLLHAMQAWEIAAAAWTAEPAQLPELTELRDDLRATCRGWRHRYPAADSTGAITGRVLDAVGGRTLREKLEDLVREFPVDMKALCLDFRLLKEARDAVAHTGLVPRALYADRELAHRLLQGAQAGLQLIMLRKLGYEANVTWHENMFRKEYHISDMFTT